jgi:(heptosyl)LPS beta-1,4-glucosyltransferase
MLSAIVITKNEEQMITGCLESLSFADEIIVVDSGSTDSTNALAKKTGAKIFKSTGVNYSQFRETGMTAASGDWLLYVDADERVSPELQNEIIATISGSPSDLVFALPRTNIYLGKQMNHGGWGGDSVIRLFHRTALSGWQGVLHEQPVYRGNLKKLSHSLIHHSHRDLESMTDKTLVFTKYEAKLRFDAHHPKMTWWRFFRVMFTEFWHRFISLVAWRDGPRGIIDGLFQVYNTFIIYALLWEMQHESRNS